MSFPVNYSSQEIFMQSKNIVSLAPILLREMVRFNLAFQRSKVQLAPPTENIYDTIKMAMLTLNRVYCIGKEGVLGRE